MLPLPYELFNPLKSSMSWEFFFSSFSEETIGAYRRSTKVPAIVVGEPGFKFRSVLIAYLGLLIILHSFPGTAKDTSSACIMFTCNFVSSAEKLQNEKSYTKTADLQIIGFVNDLLLM